jgi:hypothetical protein
MENGTGTVTLGLGFQWIRNGIAVNYIKVFDNHMSCFVPHEHSARKFSPKVTGYGRLQE